MRSSWFGPLLVAALLVASGSALAVPADKHLIVETDDGQGCLTEAKNDCYRVVEGSLDDFEQDTSVHIMLENVGSTAHNLFVTEAANADPMNVDTAGEDAFAETETIDPGETANLTFVVPEDAEGLYLWCDVQTHEALGMWLETDVAEASDPGGGEDPASEDDDGDDEPGADDGEEDGGDDVSRFLPAPGAIAALTAGLAAALVARSVDRS